MVTQVAGDVDVDVVVGHLVEQEVARATAHRHPSYDAVGVARHPDPGRCRRKGRGNDRARTRPAWSRRSLPSVRARVRTADIASGRTVVGRIGRFFDPDRDGQALRYTADRRVGIGVSGQQPAVGIGQTGDDPAFGIGPGDSVDRSEEQRVVDDEQVGPPCRGLSAQRQRRVDREHDLLDRESGSPHTRPTASQSAAVSGGNQLSMRAVTSPSFFVAACPGAYPTEPGTLLTGADENFLIKFSLSPHFEAGSYDHEDSLEGPDHACCSSADACVRRGRTRCGRCRTIYHETIVLRTDSLAPSTEASAKPRPNQPAKEPKPVERVTPLPTTSTRTPTTQDVTATQAATREAAVLRAPTTAARVQTTRPEPRR